MPAPSVNGMEAYLRQTKYHIQVTLTSSPRKTDLVLVEGLCSTSRKTSSSHTVLAEVGLPKSGLLALKEPLPWNCLCTRSKICRFGNFLLGNRSLYNLCAALPFPLHWQLHTSDGYILVKCSWSTIYSMKSQRRMTASRIAELFRLPYTASTTSFTRRF